ncbi:MAG: hypothetical protein IJ404_07410 [Clostridia bacterium]|nr:hypothetical protein [Clostridia bacterium]
MKRIAEVILVALLLTSCRSGDLMTIYSEGEPSQAVTTEEVTDTSELPVGSLKLVSLTKTVAPGKTASLTVCGLPNTEYSIVVIYDTSESVAKGLKAKYSDNNGEVSWEWRVGNQTKPGKYPIEVYSETEKISLYFYVTVPQTEE